MIRAIAITAEVVFAYAYIRLELPFHLLLHFLVGAGAALVLRSILRAHGYVPGSVLLWVIGGHVIALAPDLLFRMGVRHEHWMDFFLWHVESHFLPGGLPVWGAVTMLALAADLWTTPVRWWPSSAALGTLAVSVAVAHAKIPDGLAADGELLHLGTLVAVPAIATAVALRTAKAAPPGARPVSTPSG